MEHARPVVPVGEDPLARPALADDVVQAQRQQPTERLSLGGGHVGVALVGGGVEHVGVGGRDVDVPAHTARRGSSRASPPERRQPLRACSGSGRSRGPGRWARRRCGPAPRRRWPPPRGPRARESRGRPGSRAARPPGRPARGSRRRSTGLRRRGRPRSRGRPSSSPSSSAKASSASLVSCRQTTSGRAFVQPREQPSTRCLTELTFQVASRTGLP